MKIKKINLPDEITIEIDGAKFILDRPSNLDSFEYPDAFRAMEEGENQAKFISYRIRYVMTKLKRIEGITFEEDDKKVGVSFFKDLEPDLQIKITTEYLNKVFEFFDRRSSIKKDQEPTESEGSQEVG